jgi:gas vesicle protein
MNEVNTMSTKYVLFAFGIGLSVGAGVALLYAPQSGASTRKKIKRGAEDAGDYIEDTAAYLKEQAEALAKQAQDLVQKTQGTVTSAIDQAGGVVGGALKAAQKLV